MLRFFPTRWMFSETLHTPQSSPTNGHQADIYPPPFVLSPALDLRCTFSDSPLCFFFLFSFFPESHLPKEGLRSLLCNEHSRGTVSPQPLTSPTCCCRRLFRTISISEGDLLSTLPAYLLYNGWQPPLCTDVNCLRVEICLRCWVSYYPSQSAGFIFCFRCPAVLPQCHPIIHRYSF